jgi:hypothetical protein
VKVWDGLACEWKIVHAQNTVVDPAAQPFDPINSDWNGERLK